MKKTFATILTAFAIMSTSAVMAAPQVGIDVGQMFVDAQANTSATRLFLTLPVASFNDGKTKLAWENSTYQFADPGYGLFTSDLTLGAKTDSGLVFEGRLGVARAHSNVMDFATGLTNSSTNTSVTYGVGVRYTVADVTFRATMDVVGKFKNTNLMGGSNQTYANGHIMTVGAAYQF